MKLMGLSLFQVNFYESGITIHYMGGFLLGENAVISISNDRSVRIWLLRDSGQFWPSICHYMSAAATSMSYTHTTRYDLDWTAIDIL